MNPIKLFFTPRPDKGYILLTRIEITRDGPKFFGKIKYPRDRKPFIEYLDPDNRASWDRATAVMGWE